MAGRQQALLSHLVGRHDGVDQASQYRARPDFSDQFFDAARNGAATVNSVRYRPEVTMQFQVYL